MNRKMVYALIIGVLSAGLVCLIVGLIVRFCVNGSLISLLMSMFAIIFGAIIAGLALLFLLGFLILSAIGKSKSEKE